MLLFFEINSALCLSEEKKIRRSLKAGSSSPAAQFIDKHFWRIQPISYFVHALINVSFHSTPLICCVHVDMQGRGILLNRPKKEFSNDVLDNTYAEGTKARRSQKKSGTRPLTFVIINPPTKSLIVNITPHEPMIHTFASEE